MMNATPASAAAAGTASGCRFVSWQANARCRLQSSGLPVNRYSIDASNVAMPRNEKKPAISVTVVKTIDDDCAGS